MVTSKFKTALLNKKYDENEKLKEHWSLADTDQVHYWRISAYYQSKEKTFD